MKKIVFISLMVMSISCLAWAQGITVTSPNGGETLVLEKPWPIAWTPGSVVQKVKIQLIRPGGALVDLIEKNLAPGSSPYSWTIGQTKSGMVGAGDYKIRVITMDESKSDVSDRLFTIVAATTPGVIKRPKIVPPPRLKFPRLEVSDIDLTPNVDGFGIIFSYKNAGNGALPKASEVPVKPSYRVLIDGKETAHGSLTIPAFAAQPGWEQTAYFGGWIVLPTIIIAMKNQWCIGNTITVYINENKVMGMGSHSLSLPLKPIALKYKFDMLCNGVSLNWDTHVLTVFFRLDGEVPAGRKMQVLCGMSQNGYNYFQDVQNAKQGNFSINKEVDFPENSHSITLYIKVGVVNPTPQTIKTEDIDYRNNDWNNCKFVYPDPNPVR